MASYEPDAHGRRHRSVEIGVEPFHGIEAADPLDGPDYEAAFDQSIRREMEQGVNIPDVTDYRNHESVRQAERDLDVGLLTSLGLIGIGAAGVYIWKKHRNKE